MTLGASALLEVQWIEVAYNLSGAVPVVNSTDNVCNLDTSADEGDWQPLVFAPPHDEPSESSGYKLGINALSMLLAIAFISL
jgi:hypothetical protein